VAGQQQSDGPTAAEVTRPVIRHGTPQRGPYVPPLGTDFRAGRFGRMFPELKKPHDASLEALRALGEAMIEKPEVGNTTGDNPDVASGFTYFGQFVDHDITLDTTGIGERIDDPTQVLNFRTPRLDLDCVYGSGPGASNFLYDRTKTNHLLLGSTIQGQGDPKVKPGLAFDLPRGGQGRALIGDHRNDENLLVAQTHVSMLKFHNAVASMMPGASFAEVRRRVTWHYQYVVLRDFVGKLVDMNDLSQALKQRKFYRYEKFSAFGEPYMPVEFSVAAYRLGHSMVRQDYSHNRVFGVDGGFPSPFLFFFLFSGLSGNIVGGLSAESFPGGKLPIMGDPPAGFPFASLPSDWIIDWRRFYDFGTDVGQPQGLARNRARLIDPYLVQALHDLPGSTANGDLADHPSLAVRNLARGQKMLLPSGQDVARFMEVKDPLRPEEIAASGHDGKVAAKHGLHASTPLWYYILKEAQIRGKGHRLGPVGGRILAETFVGLLQGDKDSFLGANPGWTLEKPTWKPDLPGQSGGFAMADLLRLAFGAKGPGEDDRLSPIDLPENSNPT
jgi:hypothetical protein